jgi:hypothetical protein
MPSFWRGQEAKEENQEVEAKEHRLEAGPASSLPPKEESHGRQPAAREVVEAAIREPLMRKHKKKAKKQALSTQA